MRGVNRQGTDESQNLDILRHFLDASPNGVMIFDLLYDDGQISDFEWSVANLQSASMLGLKRNAIIGQSYRRILKGADSQHIFELALEVLATGKALEIENSFDTRSWFLVTLSRLNENLVITLKDISEQRSQQLEIESKYQELGNYFELALDLLVIANMDGYFLKLSRQWENVLGYRLDEIEGKRFLDFIHPDDIAATLTALSELDAQNSIFSFTNRYRAKDGSYRYLQWRSRPDGKLIYGAAQDVTSQYMADEKMRESDRRFRALFEQSNDAVLLLDVNGQHQLVNQKAADMLGYSVEELQALHSHEISAEPDETTLVFNRLLAGEKIPPFERVFRHKDGSVFPVEMNVELTHDETGRAIGIQAIARDISRRKQYEKNLIESERRFRALFEQSNDAVFLLDLTGKHHQANRKAADLLGYSMEEMQELSVHEISAEPDKSGSIRERLLAGEALPPYERLFRHKDGSLIPVEINAEIVRDEYSEPIHIQSIVRDIRERKAAEAELEAKIHEEHFFQEYLKRLQDIVIELTHINQLDVFYKRAVELGLEAFGFERLGLMLYDEGTGFAKGTYGTDRDGNLIAEHQLSFHPAELSGILFRALRREEHFAYDTDAVLFSNLEAIGRGANAAAVLWNGTDKLGWLAIDNAVNHEPVSVAQLEILALYALSLGSLLAQKQTQATLEESENRYRSVVEMMAEGMILHDGEGHIITCNPAAERIMGLSSAQLMGLSSINHDWHTIHEDNSPFEGENHPAMVTLRTGEAVNNVIMGLYKPDSELTWISINAQPLYTPNEGKPYGVVVTLVDITRRKKSERQALELELEKERIRVLNSFIQGSSHEFRTPLAIIKSSAYLLKKLDDPSRREEKAKLIEEQINRIVDLLAMLTKMSHLDSNITFAMQVLSVATILRNTSHRLHSEMAAKNIALILETEELSILGNAEYLTEAVFQVLRNAVQFSAEDSTIKLSSTHDDTCLRILVEDNGVGISDDVLQHVFERFYRLDTAHSTAGFGLGLSLAQNVIEKHGGEILVKSELGKGSRFELCLPLKS